MSGVDASGVGPSDRDEAELAADERWLSRAVELARANIAEGGGPFGALLVKDGELVSTGQNRVTRDNDPTAHAEVQAIRAAGAALGTFDLNGTVLYSSCEPCPLCISAALWARVDRVVYAADRVDAASAGFDDSAFYELWTTERQHWAKPLVEEHRTLDAAEPFDLWNAHSARVKY